MEQAAHRAEGGQKAPEKRFAGGREWKAGLDMTVASISRKGDRRGDLGSNVVLVHQGVGRSIF